MLRPGFEPESSARKAEMIGRTTPPEQKQLEILNMGPKAPSTGLEPVTNRLTAERSTY